MTDFDKKDREEIFSKPVRAGKRTYFFDVKATKANEYFLTITESKKRFNEDGTHFFEKHKIFLYKEDFDKFLDGMNEVVNFITDKQGSYVAPAPTEDSAEIDGNKNGNNFSDVSFDDLGK